MTRFRLLPLAIQLVFPAGCAGAADPGGELGASSDGATNNSAGAPSGTLPWTRGIVSVWRSTGLQVTPTDVNRLTSESGTGESLPNPCPTPSEYYDAYAYHEGERALVACGDGALAVTEDFPEEPFALWNLGEDISWLGPHYAASETSWYSTNRQAAPVGVQAPLVQGEQIAGHVTSLGRGYRVTNLGIAVSTLGEPAAE